MTIIIIKFKVHYIFHVEIIVIFAFGLQKVNNFLVSKNNFYSLN